MTLFAVSARAMFIGMLVIMIIVALLFGFMVFMLLKARKKPVRAADDIKLLLSRRESSIVVDIMSCTDEKRKGELVNALRRVKSAEVLIDELIKEDERINTEIEEEETNLRISRKNSNEKNSKTRPQKAQHTASGSKEQPLQKPNAVKTDNTVKVDNKVKVDNAPASSPAPQKKEAVAKPAQSTTASDKSANATPVVRPAPQKSTVPVSAVQKSTTPADKTAGQKAEEVARSDKNDAPKKRKDDNLFTPSDN